MKLATITVPLDMDSGKKVGDVPRPELAEAMNMELNEFQRWFCSQGNDTLTGLERSILRTYLAWKLLYESQSDPGSGS